MLGKAGPVYDQRMENAIEPWQARCSQKHNHHNALVYGSVVDESWSFSIIFTRSARDCACILSIARLRCTLTVFSVVPIRAAICLLGMPDATMTMTSLSRGDSNLKRSLNVAIPISRWRLSRSLASAT